MSELIVEKEPLKSSDGSMLSPWKQNTQIRRDLFLMSEIVSILLTIDKALGDYDVSFDYRCFWWSNYVQLTAKDETEARKIVGHLIRAFKKNPIVKKVADDQLEAEWMIDNVPVTVKGYKPATCRYEEIEVQIPATKRRVEKNIIPASKARVEKRRVLVCDDAKIEPQVAAEVESANEVPF